MQGRMIEVQSAVHNLVGRMFPFNVAAGWTYKGFSLRGDDGRIVIDMRFEKKIMDRRGFAVLHVYADTINAPGYDLKGWIMQQLHDQAAALVARHHQEFAGAA